MALSETKVVDQININEDGCIFYRETTKIIRDGEFVAQSHNRKTLFPGESYDGHPQNVVDVATALWTQEVIDNYQTKLSQSPGTGE